MDGTAGLIRTVRSDYRKIVSVVVLLLLAALARTIFRRI